MLHNTAMQITSIGFLNTSEGVTLVACTLENSHGFRQKVSREEFEKVRGDQEQMKNLFLLKYEN